MHVEYGRLEDDCRNKGGPVNQPVKEEMGDLMTLASNYLQCWSKRRST